MKRKLIISLILLTVVAIPAGAEAAGILDINLARIFGCFGNPFGTGCSVNEKMLFTSVACKVMQTIDSAVIPIYCNITQNPNYISALNALLVLYILLFGVGYLIGIHRARLGVVMIGLVKAAAVYFILTYAGLFFNLIYYVAVDTPKELVRSILAAHGSNTSSIFEYVDQGMYRIFDEMSQPALDPNDRQSFAAKELSVFAIAIGVKTLMPGGNFVFGLFVFVIMGWLFSYLMIVVRYLLSYLALTFMLMLAPIFIPSILFKKTAFLFDEWMRMLVSFIIEIVLVVAYVIMIEPFYTSFYEMLKKSFEGSGLTGGALQFTKGETTYLKSYNTGTDKEFVKEESVQGLQNPAEDMKNAGFGTDATDISSEVLINLVTMAVIIFLSSVFLRYIPTLASMLAGKYNFSKLFGGEQFAQKASSAGRANLFGQSGYAAKSDAATGDSDRAGGIWGDLSQFKLN